MTTRETSRHRPAAHGARHDSRTLVAQIGLVAGAALCYFGVRGLTQSGVAEARENAERLVSVERAIGISWEEAIQSAIIGLDWLVAVINWVYVYGHWPVVIIAMVALFLHRPDLRERSSELWTWPVDDPEDAVMLAGWGVTGLISDRPELLRPGLTALRPGVG
jgi:hypothetical protein